MIAIVTLGYYEPPMFVRCGSKEEAVAALETRPVSIWGFADVDTIDVYEQHATQAEVMTLREALARLDKGA